MAFQKAPCGNPECGCHEPAFTEPLEAIEFLAGRMAYAGVSDGVAKSYSDDLYAILERIRGPEPEAKE